MPTVGQRRARQNLLIAIYANPDVYPPTINAARILARDFNVRLISRNSDESALDWQDLEIERVGPAVSVNELLAGGALAKARGFLCYLGALRRAIAESRPKVIYAYDPIAFAAAMLTRPVAPVIFHCHDAPSIEELPARSLQSWLIRYAIKQTREAALVVFPEGNRAAYWLNAAGDDRAPSVVPNGAALDFFPPCDWSALAEVRWAGRRALYLSAMGPANSQFEAVDAAAGSKWTLELAGRASRDFMLYLEQRVYERRASDRVRIHGRVDDQLRMRLLREAAVGLALYKPVSINWDYSASATNKLFECAAASLPVVVPERHSYREFLADEQWVAFADVDDPRSIAKAIDSLLTDRDRYFELSRAARAAHENRLNYENLFEPLRVRISALANQNQS